MGALPNLMCPAPATCSYFSQNRRPVNGTFSTRLCGSAGNFHLLSENLLERGVRPRAERAVPVVQRRRCVARLVRGAVLRADRADHISRRVLILVLEHCLAGCG